jgi:hypothetical protein
MYEDKGSDTALLPREGPEYAGPGTTTVLPPAGPGAPPHTATATGPKPPRRGAPIWVFIVALLVAAVIVGILVALMLVPASVHTTPNVPASVTTSTTTAP